ncbi:hypothetical protein HYT18_04335 [Candidatus Microgenomates bacterium]|nr:hypothetical protein [Candidatus Microgenomates bacterium]
MTIIKKFDPDERQKKFPKKYFLLAVVSLFILTMVEIWVANTVAGFGENFAEISSLKQSLSLENQILENEIAKYASLNSVASQSAKLGFSKITSIQYIR